MIPADLQLVILEDYCDQLNRLPSQSSLAHHRADSERRAELLRTRQTYRPRLHARAYPLLGRLRPPGDPHVGMLVQDVPVNARVRRRLRRLKGALGAPRRRTPLAMRADC